MGLFDFFDKNTENTRNDVYNTDANDQEHKSKFTHEAVGGAAGFEAMRLYEQRCQREGKPQSHAMAKEILAGLASAEVDKLIETKGLDFVDREKAQREAKRQAHEALAQSGEY